MISLVLRCALPCLLLTLTMQAQIEVPPATLQPRQCSTARTLPPLPANAEQVAREIGAMPLIERLRAVVSACSPGGISVEEVALRQEISEAVIIATLDLEAVLAEIDYERAQIIDVRAQLSSKRDRRVNLLSIANIVAGTGSGIIGTALQFSDRTAFIGDGIAIGGGAGSVFLSILGMRQPGKSAPLGVAPNMLAPLFHRQAELRSVYPESVWAFLNTAPANDSRVHVPWQEELIDEWVKAGRIGPPDAPASQKKIELLTSRVGQPKHLSIDVLTDRGAMLLDLRSRVLLMSRDLRDLMRAVSLGSSQHD